MSTSKWYMSRVLTGIGLEGFHAGATVFARLTSDGRVHVLGKGPARVTVQLAAARQCLEAIRDRSWRAVTSRRPEQLDKKWSKQ